jgi:hypothetical protein
MLESGKTRAVRAFVTASSPRRPDAHLSHPSRLCRRNAGQRPLARPVAGLGPVPVGGAVALYPPDMAVFLPAVTRRLASSSAAVAEDRSQASKPAARGQ